MANKIILVGLQSDWKLMYVRISSCSSGLHQMGSGDILETYYNYPSLMGLNEDYNDLVFRTLTILTDSERAAINLSPLNFKTGKETSGRDAYGVIKEINFISHHDAYLTLDRMSQGYAKATAIIGEMLTKTGISAEKEKELQPLIDIIDKKFDIAIPVCSSDLRRSIEEYRKGSLLGAVLISGRIIDVAYDKILVKIAKDASTDPDKVTQEEINRFIQEKLFGEDKGGGRLAVSGILTYRNLYSHNIGTYPKDENEVIGIISNCVSVLTKIIDRKLYSEFGLK